MICTIHLLERKLEDDGRLAPVEFSFFGGVKSFRHNILRRIKPKEM